MNFVISCENEGIVKQSRGKINVKKCDFFPSFSQFTSQLKKLEVKTSVTLNK